MADLPIEQQLREFLDSQARLHREGKTIETLHEKNDQMMVALRRVARDRLEDRASLARHGQAIKTLQSQVSLLTDAVPQVPTWRAPKDETTTGSHLVAEIAKAKAEALQERLDEEAERKYDEETWWRRQRWLWLGIATVAILGAMITGCVGYISYRIQTLEKTLENQPAPRPAK